MKLAIVGLGRVSTHHLAALALCPDIDIVSGFDTNPSRLSSLPPHVRREVSLGDLLRNPEVQTVLIATPPPTHDQLALQAIHARKSVVLEKPAALSPESFQRLREAALSNAIPVFTLFHAAYGPEVAAARAALVSSPVGSLLAWHSAFHDPYETDTHARCSLLNSWIDSGINALSVVLTVLGDVRLRSSFSSHTPPATRWATASSVQTFEVAGAWSGLVTIECNWTTGLNHKSSRLVFGSGERLVLDHTNEALLRAAPADPDYVTASYRTPRPRLINHYIRAFTDAAEAVSSGRSNWEFSSACHNPYFSAFGGRP